MRLLGLRLLGCLVLVLVGGYPVRFRHRHWDRVRDWLLWWRCGLVGLLALLSGHWLRLWLLLGLLWHWAGLWVWLRLLLGLWAGLRPLWRRGWSGLLVYGVITPLDKDRNVSHHTRPLSTPLRLLLGVLLWRVLLLPAELPLLLWLRLWGVETKGRLLLLLLWMWGSLVLLLGGLLRVLLWVWLLVLLLGLLVLLLGLLVLVLGIWRHERPGDCVELRRERGVLRGRGGLGDGRGLWCDTDL